MRLTLDLSLAVLSILSTAASKSYSRSDRNCPRQPVISYVAKYENTNGGPVNRAPAREINSLKEYEGLFYNSIVVVPAAPADAGAGLQVRSPPNVVAYGIVDMIEGSQNLTTNYVDSESDYFNFKSFYFACAVNTEEPVVGVPGSCSITMEGFKLGRKVASQTSSFTAKLPLSEMQFVQLNRAFSNVDTVSFETNGVAQNAALATLLDNLAYDVTYKRQ